MKLLKTETIKSPLNKNHIRITGEIYYDTFKKSEIYWFDLPVEYAKRIHQSGNPWLICLLPLAMTINEDISIDLPLDPMLIKNIKKIMKIWKCWYDNLSIIKLNTPNQLTLNIQPIKTAAFFSGGIDSLYTLLSNENDFYNQIEPKYEIDTLLTIWGFDIPLTNKENFNKLIANYLPLTDKLNKELICITTNIKETLWNKANWGKLSHGAGLASIGFLLENIFKEILIGSSYGYAYLMPWGSHTIIDPLFTSSILTTIHHGGYCNRVEKTKFLLDTKIALDYLRVCWKHGIETNCSCCSKCYRTMFTLDNFDALETCGSFNKTFYSEKYFDRIYLRNKSDILFMQEILDSSRKNNNIKVYKTINKIIKRSTLLNIIYEWLEILSKKRFFWKITCKLKEIILKNKIT